MNLLNGIVGGREEILLEKNGRYYRFLKQDGIPKDSIDAINRWDEIQKLDMAEAGRVSSILCPVVPQKMFLPAVNFRSHSKESSAAELKEPYFFTKFSHTLVPHKGSVIKPNGIARMDYEGEIGIIMGKKGKYIPEKEAEEHIFGYTVVNDVSIRDYQNSGHPIYGKDWVLGKNADTALPMGPWITPKSAFKNFSTTIETRLNGQVVQHGSTDDMIFDTHRLISRLSQDITLVPGDLIATGTPAGVAEYTTRKYLEPGDEVEITVDGIGTLKHNIIADPYNPVQ